MSQMHDRHNSSMILQVPPSILKQVTHNQVNLHERSPHLSLSLVSMIHSWMFSRNIKYETFEMDVLWSCHLRCLTTRGRITMLLMFLLNVSPSVIALSTSLRRWMIWRQEWSSSRSLWSPRQPCSWCYSESQDWQNCSLTLVDCLVGGVCCSRRKADVTDKVSDTASLWCHSKSGF